MNVSMNMSSMSALSASRRPPPPPPPEAGENGGPQSAQDILSSLDADESGGLTLEEISDSPLSNFITQDNWSDVDTDGDGALSVSELEAHRESVGPPPGDGAPPPGGAGGPPDADPMAMFESLLDDISTSEAATDSTATYAKELYSAMEKLFASLEA